MRNVGRSTVELNERPSVYGYAAVVGKKEGEGPLGQYFDEVYADEYVGEKTFELAESRLQSKAVNLALGKANISNGDVNFIFAGDLLNQCIGSSFSIKKTEIPYLGLYGACSTMALSLSLAALSVGSGCGNNAVAVTSSHFCSAERQYRFPLEYGGQRTPTSQWTVTGSGSAVVGKHIDGKPYINNVCFGKIVDFGVKDANNMGAAMAPAAYDTLTRFFEDTKTKAEDYDMIFTGDLGYIGSELLYELFSRDGVNLRKYHKDCGIMIYDRDTQDVHAGGSGCGCSASVLCSYIFDEMNSHKYNNILFIATGALMSPVSSEQGRAIPSIAHLVNIRI